MNEATIEALTRAVQDLTDEIARYRKVKERGIRLAEEIESRRTQLVLD